MSESVMKFGVIGAGSIAQTYFQIFKAISFANVVAVADVREEAARAAAEDLGCSSFRSYEELSEKAEVDAVLVCTPPANHAEICLHFLERRVPVLCEKPLATDSATARQMVEVAEKNDTLLTMASKFRYVEDVIRAKSIVASGILGEIILFENSFTSRVDMSNRWNADRTQSGGGVLIDNGTHSVDIVRYFLGPIAEVQAVEGKRVQSVGVEDTARLFVRTESGVMGSIDLSWTLNKELDSYLDIYGSHGTIRVGWKESRYRQTTSQDWITFGKGYNKIQAMGDQIENFCMALHGIEPVLITGRDAIASVEVIEAAYASTGAYRWVQAGSNGVAHEPVTEAVGRAPGAGA